MLLKKGPDHLNKWRIVRWTSARASRWIVLFHFYRRWKQDVCLVCEGTSISRYSFDLNWNLFTREFFISLGTFLEIFQKGTFFFKVFPTEFIQHRIIQTTGNTMICCFFSFVLHCSSFHFSRRPNTFPFAFSSAPNPSENFSSTNKRTSTTSSQSRRQNNETSSKKCHIKKPLNAFMLFMKEQRSQVVQECTLRESAAINQILGRKVSSSLDFHTDKQKSWKNVQRSSFLTVARTRPWCSTEILWYGAKRTTSTHATLSWLVSERQLRC